MPEAADPSDDRRVIVLLWLAGVAVFTIYYCRILGARPAYWPDTYEYAVAARAVAQGEGLVTHACSVLEFWFLYRGTLPLDYFLHDSGNSLLLAALFRLLGANDTVVPLGSGILFTLLPPLVFLAGRHLFDRWTGILAATLTIGNSQLLAFSVTGLSEVPAAFGLTLVLCLLLWRSPSSLIHIATGAAFGALTVLRSNFVACLPWILAFLWLNREPRPPSSRARSWSLAPLALFLAGAAIFALPNATRSYAAVGMPLFTVARYYMPLYSTAAMEEKAKEIYSLPGLPIDPTRYVIDHPEELALKAGRQLRRLILELTTGGTGVGDSWGLPILLFLFLLSGLAPPVAESVRHSHFRHLAYLLFLTPIGLALVFQIRLRYLYPFIPIVLVYDAELLGRILERIRGVDGGSKVFGQVAIIVIALSALPARLTSDLPPLVAHAWRLDDYYRAIGDFVRENTRRGAVILAPAPELRPVAWYGRREIVELSDYTLVKLQALPGRGPLIILLTTGPGRTRLRGFPSPGFAHVARWQSKFGEAAVLLREDQSSAAARPANGVVSLRAPGSPAK